VKVPGTARTFSLSQIGYWAVSALLMFTGLVAVIASQWIVREGPRLVIGEIGAAVLTAGILAALVEPFFRREFAKDAFLAAFRYVLPPEFREEVQKILRNIFICERQIWTVEVKRINEDVVFVTTSFDRNLINKTSTTQKKSGLYTIPEFHFPNGESIILECGIENENERINDFQTERKEQVVRATTKEISVPPGKTVRVWGKATQYRRSRDIIYETFGTPAINPEIEVVVPDDMMHTTEFGTIGDVKEARYTKRYQLHGVYFPGQYMFVQWWPKPATTGNA
jgi:hypothetical protein